MRTVSACHALPQRNPHDKPLTLAPATRNTAGDWVSGLFPRSFTIETRVTSPRHAGALLGMLSACWPLSYAMCIGRSPRPCPRLPAGAGA